MEMRGSYFVFSCMRLAQPRCLNGSGEHLA
jgi:hypothetical protein